MSDVAERLVHQNRRRSHVEAEQLVREYESSGLTRQAFCAGRGLSVTALDKYRRRYGERAGNGGRMVPVEVVTGLAATSNSRSALYLESPKGWRIGVGSGFDAVTLQRLLTVLEQV